MKLKTVQIENKMLCYADYNAEQKNTVIMAHGLTGNHKQMHYYAELLKQEYRVISVDLMGRGKSSKAYDDTSIDTHVNDIRVLIETLKIENPVLMGYSMGAFIMSKLATIIDVKALILLDGGASCTDHQRKIVEPSLGRISKHYENEEEYLKTIETIYTSLGVPWGAHMLDVGAYEITQVDGHVENTLEEDKIRHDFDSFYAYDSQHVFEKIKVPILLIHATGDIGTMPPLFIDSSYTHTLQAAHNIQKVTTSANHYTLVFAERSDVNPYIMRFLEKM